MTLEIGTILHSRYRIIKVIAQGGMGAVYHAQDKSLGVEVAVKENYFSTEEASRQFHREATILAKLRHQNLPRVTDHFILPNQGQYLVMDYIQGEDLRQRITQPGTLPEDEIILIGIAICDALTYLHNREPSIVHRDIKPGNIKITPSGQVYLVDFGLAKVVKPGNETTIGAQALTPGFAPPEQYGKGTDSRSDIYSLGATLYAALTDNIPEDSLARAMGSAVLTPIRKHNPVISEQTASIVEKSMAVEQDGRYQSAKEFKQALLNASPTARRKRNQMDGIRITTPPISSIAKVDEQTAIKQPNARRKVSIPSTRLGTDSPSTTRTLPLIPIIIAGFTIVCFVILGGLFALGEGFPLGFNQQPSVTQPQSIIAENHTPEITDIPELAATSPPTAKPSLSLTEPLSPTFTSVITPLGGASSQIAFASIRSGIPQIWLMNSNGNILQKVTNLSDGACQPDWSPDGTRLVITSPCRNRQESYKGSGIFIVNADGTGLTPLPSVPGGDFDPNWSPDGTQITFTSLRDGFPTIYIYDLNANNIMRISSTSSYDQQPSWSPDGEWIAFESTRLGVSQVWVMDSNGGSPKEFSSIRGGAAYMPAWSTNGEVIVYSQGPNPVRLFAKQFTNRDAPEVTVSDFRPAWNADYSLDGFWLVFESQIDGNLDIYRIMTNGSNLTRLTEEEGDDFDPVWHPPIN